MVEWSDRFGLIFLMAYLFSIFYFGFILVFIYIKNKSCVLVFILLFMF